MHDCTRLARRGIHIEAAHTAMMHQAGVQGSDSRQNPWT